MKLTSTILFDFVNDFKLEVCEFGVCFDAIINFNLPIQNFNLQSEVSMEPSLSYMIDTVYLLNPVILKYSMPTFFNDVNHQFRYIYHKGLIITGNKVLLGAYSISIFPRSPSCTRNTYAELRAKKLN